MAFGCRVSLGASGLRQFLRLSLVLMTLTVLRSGQLSCMLSPIEICPCFSHG